MDRVILHCDMNGFFASVELLDYPQLRDKPMAVCGNPDNRHGIILAKNEIAKQYGVTYPTVRLRLDRLIQKIKISEDTVSDPFISLVKKLAINDKLDFDTAKLLITEYKNIKEEK